MATMTDKLEAAIELIDRGELDEGERLLLEEKRRTRDTGPVKRYLDLIPQQERRLADLRGERPLQEAPPERRTRLDLGAITADLETQAAPLAAAGVGREKAFNSMSDSVGERYGIPKTYPPTRERSILCGIANTVLDQWGFGPRDERTA